MGSSLAVRCIDHEIVHHLERRQRDDNRIENLELCTFKSQPPGQRVADKIAWATDFLREYGLTVNGQQAMLPFSLERDRLDLGLPLSPSHVSPTCPTVMTL